MSLRIFGPNPTDRRKPRQSIAKSRNKATKATLARALIALPPSNRHACLIIRPFFGMEIFPPRTKSPSRWIWQLQLWSRHRHRPEEKWRKWTRTHVLPTPKLPTFEPRSPTTYDSQNNKTRHRKRTKTHARTREIERNRTIGRRFPTSV
ncbi:hypothetical protein RSAG8_01171, partial [Rhizoctonia solani AG-8 WAC10335]